MSRLRMEMDPQPLRVDPNPLPYPLLLPVQVASMTMSYPRFCHLSMTTMMTMSMMSTVPHLEFESVLGVTGECRRLGTMRFSRWPQTS